LIFITPKRVERSQILAQKKRTENIIAIFKLLLDF